MDEVNSQESPAMGNQNSREPSLRESPEEPRNIRPATHADSWYSAKEPELRSELQEYLDKVPHAINEANAPIARARVIISPHAGYRYSGPCAAWAFKCLDLSAVKRVFVLGPSHAYYLRGCAVTAYDEWDCPFGELEIDTEVRQAVYAEVVRLRTEADTKLQQIREDIAELPNTNNNEPKDVSLRRAELDERLRKRLAKIKLRSYIPKNMDMREHSMEMQIPYLYLRLQETFESPADFPKIVPVLIGDNNREAEKKVGEMLLPYIKDPENAFIVSSDFCHWGKDFKYMPYSPEANPMSMRTLDQYSIIPKTGLPIHESIKAIDETSMEAVKSGKHDDFCDNIHRTGNTVCGRHPIGAMMAALEILSRKEARPTEDRGGQQIGKANEADQAADVESEMTDVGSDTTEESSQQTDAGDSSTLIGSESTELSSVRTETTGRESEVNAHGSNYRFKFVRYERSNHVTSPSDFSVSYCSAYAVV